jgi:hypothetical protein
MFKLIRRLVTLAFLLLIVIGAGLCFTNPDRQAFIDHMTSQLTQGDDADEGSLVLLGRKVLEGAAELAIRDNVQRQNWLLFSVYTYRPPLTSEEDALHYLGMANGFVDLNERR